MKDDKRTLIAIVLCIFFYLAYDRYLKSKYPEYGKHPETGATSDSGTQPSSTTATTPGSSPATPGQAPAASDAAATIPLLSDADLTFDTEFVTYRFSQQTGGLVHVELKKFKVSKAPDAGNVELLDSPIALQGVLDTHAGGPVPGIFQAERQGRTIRLSRDLGTVHVTQEYTVPESGYSSTLKLTFTNNGPQPADMTAGLLFQETAKPKKSSSLLGFIPGVVVERVQLLRRVSDKTKLVDLQKLCKDDEPISGKGEHVSYIGIDRHYFLGVFEPRAKTQNFEITHRDEGESGCRVTALTYDDQGLIAPGASTVVEYGLYFGPKSIETLKTDSAELVTAMDLGVFEFIAQPLLLAIEGFHTVTGNYGLSIVLLTFLLKVLFYPLVRASSISAYNMRKLNPQITALREKFKDDKQRQQQEMMKLWVEHKVNPMKGCLPILPQIPVFFAFYQVLQHSISLRHAPFFGWIQDLSAMDPFFVTPLLMGVAMMVQQRLTPTTGMDKTQEKIMMFMPIMFTAMMVTLPAGLTLYMLTNTVTGICQQKWLYYKLDKTKA